MGQDGVDPANHGTNIRRLLRFIYHKNALLEKRRAGGAEHALLECSGTISLERTKLPQCSALSVHANVLIPSFWPHFFHQKPVRNAFPTVCNTQ